MSSEYQDYCNANYGPEDARLGDKTIPAEYVLPCDFIVGHMRFRKGVKLETVRRSAERWFKIACDAYFKPDPAKIAELKKMFAEFGHEG